MMESATVFVLTSLVIDTKGNVTCRNLGVTLNLHEAENHRARGVEYDFEVFQIDANWQEDVATTDLVAAMREFRGMVRQMQEEALR
jgi:hypothetical protein